MNTEYIEFARVLIDDQDRIRRLEESLRLLHKEPSNASLGSWGFSRPVPDHPGVLIDHKPGVLAAKKAHKLEIQRRINAQKLVRRS